MQTEITYSAFESRYRNKEYIGSGGFGKVYKVFDHAKNHYVALKVADVRPEWKKFSLRNEVELVNKLPLHRNIARYDACYRFNTGFTGEMDFAILRFYEYGNLEQFLNNQQLKPEDKRLIIQGVLDGIAFLHRRNVIHRDLKAQNILLHREDGVWTPKITDFGLSREILEQGNITNSAIGISYSYAAPEQIQNKKIFKNVDLWAAGVIVYRVMAGELPFKGRADGDDKSSQSQLELSRKIVNLELPEKLETLSEPYRTLIKRCLVVDPLERAQTAEELIQILQGEQIAKKVPAPGVPKNEEEQTQVIEEANVKKDPLPIESKVVDKKVENPLSGADYGQPKKNVTQILKKAIPKEPVKEPVVIEEFTPKMGGRKSGFKIWWILLLLALAGSGYGGWWLWNKYQNEPATTTAGKTSVDKDTSVTTAAKKANEYIELNERVDKARNSKTDLIKIEREVNELISKDRNNYRLDYLLAKSKSYQGQTRMSNKLLKEAAVTARNSGEAENMMNKLIEDKEIVFKKLTRLEGGKHWSRIILELEKSINRSQNQ